MWKKQEDILKTKTDSISLPSLSLLFLLSAEKKNPYEKKKADIFIDGFLMTSRERLKEKKKESNESQSHAWREERNREDDLRENFFCVSLSLFHKHL